MIGLTAALCILITACALGGLAWIVGRGRTRFWLRVPPWVARAFVLAATLGLVAVSALTGPMARAAPFDCAAPPPIDYPGFGLTGKLDPYGVKIGSGQSGTSYDLYGYAGQVWHTYDIGCGGEARNPMVPTMTMLSNGLFNVAKDAVALTNGLHYLLVNDETFNWLNDVVKAVSGSLFEGVFSVWVPLALLILGAVLLWHGAKSDNAGAAKRLTWGIIGFWMAASAALLPVTYNDFFRGYLVDMTATAQSGFVDSDNWDRRDMWPSTVTQTVVYENWLAGEFGKADSELAKQYGKQLLDAQACAKREWLRDGECDQDAKGEKFEDIASQVEEADAYAYSVLKGEEYWPRMGAATVAAFQGVYIVVFQIVAKMIIILSLVMIAILIFLLPITGLIGMINPETLKGNIKVFGTAFVNAIMMGLLSGLHIRLVVWATNNLGFLSQSVFLLLVTILLLMIARPIKRMKSMISATMQVANASFERSYPRMRYPKQRRHKQRGNDGDDEPRYSVAPPRQGVRWHSANRGTPEERTADTGGSGAVEPAGPIMPPPGGGDGASTPAEGPIYATATRVNTPGGSGNGAAQQRHDAARTLAATALRTDSGAGRSRPSDTGVSGRLALSAGEASGSAPEPPSSPPSGEQPGAPNAGGGTGGNATPTREHGRAGPEQGRSSLGLVDSGQVYRPSATEAGNQPGEATTAEGPSTLDAAQDETGAWYVPSDRDEQTGGQQ
ncbi:hypothetical protein SAMN04487819_1252 [Actinopolyspora alba]|uniref:TrbL/VirB6 plasmid conjugal transfer protein n=1 Tax=Actinopolyspora alba TaxID=673379 RepID=A0A1I2CKM2_9ACTN|nr:hypothetical protein [Actinopolyspora alba]SFE68851.1 hypothetical protein SAMN04487819_1252 [Actinopolyspora alba]